MSYEIKPTLRHHRISQHLQVSCHLVNSLNPKILMNLKLKHVLPRLITRACWKHTSLPGATGMLLFPYGSPSQVGDAAGPRQSVAHLRGAGPAAHRSTGMSVLLCSALMSHMPLLRRCCPALMHTTSRKRESSHGGGCSPPHPTLKVRP